MRICRSGLNLRHVSMQLSGRFDGSPTQMMCSNFGIMAMESWEKAALHAMLQIRRPLLMRTVVRLFLRAQTRLLVPGQMPARVAACEAYAADMPLAIEI